MAASLVSQLTWSRSCLQRRELVFLGQLAEHLPRDLGILRQFRPRSSQPGPAAILMPELRACWTIRWPPSGPPWCRSPGQMLGQDHRRGRVGRGRASRSVSSLIAVLSARRFLCHPALGCLPMSAVELVALASSVSLLTGWRLCRHFGHWPGRNSGWSPCRTSSTPSMCWRQLGDRHRRGQHLAEFFADKIAWVDSAWDAIHSVVGLGAGSAWLSSIPAIGFRSPTSCSVAARPLSPMPARPEHGPSSTLRQSLFKRRRLDRRRHRHRRTAGAGHRQSDRRRDHRWRWSACPFGWLRGTAADRRILPPVEPKPR